MHAQLLQNSTQQQLSLILVVLPDPLILAASTPISLSFVALGDSADPASHSFSVAGSVFSKDGLTVCHFDIRRLKIHLRRLLLAKTEFWDR
jgi:hypothetical protein